jgi:hypothetical protein
MLENNDTVVFSNDKSFLQNVVNIGWLVCFKMAGHARVHVRACVHTHTHMEHGILMSLFLCEKECRPKTVTQNKDKDIIGVHCKNRLNSNNSIKKFLVNLK